MNDLLYIDDEIINLEVFLATFEDNYNIYTAKSTKEAEKILKDNEFEWGKKMLLLKNKNIKVNKQWTNKFGEYICEEIYTLLDKNVYIPKKINHFQPDLETDNEIIEVKTGTYGTEGTAHEKILGVPFFSNPE